MTTTTHNAPSDSPWRRDQYAMNLGLEAFYDHHMTGQCLVYKEYWERGAAWTDMPAPRDTVRADRHSFTCPHCGHRSRYNEAKDEIEKYSTRTVKQEDEHWNKLRELRRAGYPKQAKVPSGTVTAQKVDAPTSALPERPLPVAPTLPQVDAYNPVLDEEEDEDFNPLDA